MQPFPAPLHISGVLNQRRTPSRAVAFSPLLIGVPQPSHFSNSCVRCGLLGLACPQVLNKARSFASEAGLPFLITEYKDGLQGGSPIEGHPKNPSARLVQGMALVRHTF